MAITDVLNLTPEVVAEQNPELHEMRKIAFGENYLQDIAQGTGTAQYYTGWGNVPTVDWAQQDTVAPVPAATDATPVVGGGGPDAGLMSVAPTDVGSMPTVPAGGIEGGVWGPMDYLQPITQEGGDASIAEAIAAQDRQDAFDQQFAFEDPKALAARGIEPDPILPEARPEDVLPEGFDPYFSLEAPGITPIERTPQLEETPVMWSEFDDLEADPGTQPIEGITPEAQSAWEKVKSGVSTAGDFIKNYGMSAYNFLAGSPVGAAASLLTQPFTSSESQIEYESYSPETKQAVDQAYGPGGLMEGYNAVSMMGEGVEATIQDRIDTINKTLETKDSEILEARKTELTNLLNTVQEDKGKQATDKDLAIATGIEAADIDPADVGVEAAGVDFSADRTPENISQAVDDLAAQYDAEVAMGERVSDATVTSDVNKAKAVIEMPQMLGDVGQGEPMGRDDPTPPSRPGGAPASGPHGNGGGGGGGGGKIVCTMMNDSYGFGSFRNKIWLRQSKTLPMEYQLGYHALFLPLVKFSKRKGLINKAVKKVLEHIAIHRTIDIRQEARGKKHMLGRVYRKILEPICYWVGKYGKRT